MLIEMKGVAQREDPAIPDAAVVNPASLKQELVAFAARVGFNSCRVARCQSPKHTSEFRNWLGEGAAGEMEWMKRTAEKRSDPQMVLPGAQSIIVFALNYWQGKRPEGSASTRPGRIARYAWGDDYHQLISDKLDQIDRFLKARGGIQKCYVDTGPMLERDHAAAAGVGWHGKSTMLVDTKLGTWFFLAEILTTLELSPDFAERERCGSCVRCISACPTGAITAPHHLDARRCISYLTIELKGAIPLEFRPLIGDRIYGCDDCLDACPWNRFAETSRESAFAARTTTVGMALREYLKLGEEEFRAWFRHSPIKRIKRRGFLRNVCVALGNVGGAGDLPALELAARDPEPLIAEHATWAIDRVRERLKSQAAKIVESKAASTASKPCAL